MSTDERVTHYCLWDAKGRVRVAAVCGAWMRRRDHADHPTCPACRARVEAMAARRVEDLIEPEAP